MLPTKFWFIWPSDFQRRRFFRNQPIRNKNGLCWPCLLTDQDKISNLYRGPSIDASYMYQVSVHLAEGFQRRRLKCEKLTDDRRRMTSDGKSSSNLNCPTKNVAQHIYAYFHVCLPLKLLSSICLDSRL